MAEVRTRWGRLKAACQQATDLIWIKVTCWKGLDTLPIGEI